MINNLIEVLFLDPYAVYISSAYAIFFLILFFMLFYSFYHTKKLREMILKQKKLKVNSRFKTINQQKKSAQIMHKIHTAQIKQKNEN